MKEDEWVETFSWLYSNVDESMSSAQLKLHISSEVMESNPLIRAQNKCIK